MEKPKNIRALIGLKQEDLALLLKVTQSQLAMYETGKRNLPIAAKLQLIAMLQHVEESAYKNREPEPHVIEQEHLSKKKIADLVIINKHNQMVLDKKIEKTEQKYASNLTVLNLVRYLEYENDKYPNHNSELLSNIKTKAFKEIAKHGLHIQTEYHIKRATLQAEAKVLENYLQNLE